MKTKKIFKRILKNKANGQLYIIIDKHLNWKEGEYIKLEVQEDA